MESVHTFLRRMDQLPMEESARKGFVDQFLLHIDNTAHAFIAYVKEMTWVLIELYHIWFEYYCSFMHWDY